jgi:hypothetical protein
MLVVCNQEHQTQEFAEAELHKVRDSRKIIFLFYSQNLQKQLCCKPDCLPSFGCVVFWT